MVRFRFQRRDGINQCDFDIILTSFWLKSIVLVLFLIKSDQSKSIKSLKESINRSKKSNYIKKFIYFDFFDYYQSPSITFRSLSINSNLLDIFPREKNWFGLDELYSGFKFRLKMSIQSQYKMIGWSGSIRLLMLILLGVLKGSAVRIFWPTTQNDTKR